MAKRKSKGAAAAASPAKRAKHSDAAAASSKTVEHSAASVAAAATGHDVASAAIPTTVHDRFAPGLFEPANVERMAEAYAASEPYHHAVQSPLVADALLHAVRAEIRSQLSFTEKTTDIYRIWQSGDLANLDGLDAAALRRLPALRALRDALYSPEFRAWLAGVTGSGPLSGQRTDMAVNVYRPGGYLLCHDDVIGTRRVSYILYLTEEWRPEWGGALRLYATEQRARPSDAGTGTATAYGDAPHANGDAPNGTGANGTGANHTTIKVPRSHHEPQHAIPPSWNQLSFFAVQPGASYHDVEEVYVPAAHDVAASTGAADPEQRTRVAISGWFHLPQPGEPGHVAGLAEQQLHESSLAQLQRANAAVDVPQPCPVPFAAGGASNAAEPELTEADLDFLVQYISPQYLTPAAVDAAAAAFAADSLVTLPCFLNRATAARLGAYVTAQPPSLANDMSGAPAWRTAGPPHKQRFLFQPPPTPAAAAHPAAVGWHHLAPLFHAPAFRTYLRLLTQLAPTSVDALLRRFRRGYDYQLARNYTAREPRLELTLGLTPSAAQRAGAEAWWVPPEDGEDDEEEEDGGDEEDGERAGHVASTDGKAKAKVRENENAETEEIEAGGEEIYMAADPSAPSPASPRSASSCNNSDADTDDDDECHGFSPPPRHAPAQPAPQSSARPLPSTGAPASHARARTTQPHDDPAVYRAARSGADDADDADDGILHANPPAWNALSLVLRDRDVLRAVRYLCRHAAGDRWDVVADYAVEEDEYEDEDGDEDGDGDGDEVEDEDENGA